MRERPIQDLILNPMTAIADEWMLLTAGTEARGFNTMTVSWGHLGSLWGKYSAVVYVRPQRYTKVFLDREDLFTITIFDGDKKKDLSYLGSHSGRDEDKVARVGLTPWFEEGFTGFEEARLTLVCRKLYRAPLTEEGFLDKSILASCYPERDLHEVYVGEIVKSYTRDGRD